LNREDGTDTLSRNVGKQLPHDAAQYPRRAQISPTLRQKLEIMVFAGTPDYLTMMAGLIYYHEIL
jgi:hypothetical protein